MSKKLSIITINYNNLEGLQKTMQNVLSQTWQEFEYIIIDGCSTDGSTEYIKSQSDKIDYWVSENDSGIYNAMNKGIDKATGEYVVFMNSGDFFVALNTLESCYEVLRTKEADVFYGQIIVNENSKDRTVVYPKILTLKYMEYMVINHQACFFKLATLLENSGYDERYNLAADYHYYLKLYIAQKIFRPILFPIVKYDVTGISSMHMDEYRVEMKQVWSDTVPVFLITLENEHLKLLSTIKSSKILKIAFKLREYKIRLFNAK